MTFILVLVKIDLSIKKKSSKWGTTWPSYTTDIEIVFALLAEMVVFYMQLSIIEIWKLCFYLAFLWPFMVVTLCLEKQIYTELYYLLYIFFGIYGKYRYWSCIEDGVVTLLDIKLIFTNLSLDCFDPSKGY